MSAEPILNLSVVIPTRNSMPYIEEHIASLNQWVSSVREVIVMDSESIDGTLECIQKDLKHANVTYLNHPPGLYQSWNAAIQQAESKYTYIATVNDHMPFATLARLYEEAERYQADVVVSEPTIVTESGRPQGWPIHRFVESCAIDTPSVVESLELLVWNSIDLPGTLIGSSASNLYRTSALKAQPFPCDYGHAGDSAWAILGSLNLKWLVVPNVESTFWYHGGSGPSSGKGRALRTRLYELAAAQVAEASVVPTLSSSEQECVIDLQQLLDFWERGQQATLEYHTYRSARIPWIVLPRAWMSRARKNRNSKEFKARGDLLLGRLRELYGHGSKIQK